MSLITPPVVASKPEFDTRSWVRIVQRFLLKVDSEGLAHAATDWGTELTLIELPSTPEFAADRDFQAAVIEVQNALDQFDFAETVMLDKYVRDIAEGQED